ncbi:dihydroorotase [Pelomicrobium sp. G1]|uniref:dihydroorotase n=1 Tax=unclassified Pelomicrobium TaxID=2815318 RepID=UPI003F76461B
MKIHVKGGRLIDPASGVDRIADLYVAAGRVAAVGEVPEGFHANRVIDAAGLIVCPGLVDLSARLREPGYEYKATLESEMQAAIAGGVTSLACPPDTDPPLDEPGLVEMLKHRARLLNQAHVYPIGALTVGLAGERLTEMSQLAEAGCVAFSQADVPIVDTLVLMRAMQYAATFGFSVWLQPQDPFLARAGVAHDGEVATRLGLPPVPACAEVIDLERILLLARETGARVHLCRVSHAETLRRIAAARAEGLPVTCDVSIHHLHLCEIDLGFFDSNCRLNPPLRSLRDRDALREALASGVVDAVCSDHTPVDDDAKQFPFAEAAPGATGLELLLPLTLKWAEEARVPLMRALARLTRDPARILGIDAGTLRPGAVADVCIFDPKASWVVEPGALHSQGRNTPFLGLELSGRTRYTLVAGNVVYAA